MKPSDPLSHNRLAWNRLAKKRDRLARPAQARDFEDPLSTFGGKGWLGSDITGKRVLCLAAGGGRQGPVYASAGAAVTVVDLSPEMLALDRKVCEERSLELRTVETSMDDLSAFQDGEFDIVIQPVSTCYVADVLAVYQEVARVLRPGGLYISQHKQPVSLQASVEPVQGYYRIESSYKRNEPLEISQRANWVREDGTLEFIHGWEAILGYLCRSGFVIEDITEPDHAKPDAAAGTFGHRSQFVPAYVRVKARRVGRQKGNATLIIS